jgi:CRP/FNR family cyclic AMP-dependent transcriptional regulator
LGDARRTAILGELSENKVWYLKQSRLFDDASDNVVRECEHLFTQISFARRHVIFEQGEPGRLVYLVKSGHVRIARSTAEGDDLTVAILGPNDLFGEEVAFHDVERSTFAVCTEDSLLCVANGRDLFALITRHAPLAINIARYLGQQRDEALSVVEDLAFLKVPERLTRLLDKLASEHGRDTDDGILIDVALTHADIASLIGSTRETVSLQLKKMEKDGRIRIAGRRIVLCAIATKA